MIHGPCGKYNPNSPCMDKSENKCSKNFPKQFVEKTDYTINEYPIYRRRNNGRNIVYNEQRIADNLDLRKIGVFQKMAIFLKKA